MSSRAVSSPPLDLGSLLLALSLPTSPRRSPEFIVMDRLNVRLYETHEEVSLARAVPKADAARVFVFPDRVSASPVTLRVVYDEGRSGDHDVPSICIDRHSESESDDIIRAVFEKSTDNKVPSGATAAPPKMEHDADAQQKPRRRPLTIADMDVRELDYDSGRTDTLLTPADASLPTTPNAYRLRRESEKMDYGINWIEAFKMEEPRQGRATLADEVDGRLSAMEQEEKEKELMAETLQKVDEVAKGRTNEGKRSTVLFDSSITAKDIFGQSAKSDDVVFNASISLDDIFAGIKAHYPPPKKSTADKYYYHDDDEEDEEVLPPEVADLYSDRPSSSSQRTRSSLLPHSSSVNMNDVFAALEKRQHQQQTNFDDYYADPPSEVFSDSALSSRQHTESKATGRDEEEDESGTRWSSSGVSAGKTTPPRDDTSWLSSLVDSPVPQKRRSVELRLAEASTDTDDEPSPPLDPEQFYSAETPKPTRKESYLQVDELFSTKVHKPSDKPARIEEEPSDSGAVADPANNLDWITRLADSNAEEILDVVFNCVAEGGNGGKKCGCQACDPTRSIYLERDAVTATDERKRSLHVINPVEITLEEVFDGPKTPVARPRSNASGAHGERDDSRATDVLPPVDIDLEKFFSTPVHSPAARELVDSEKWQPRTIVKEIHRAVTVPQERKRSAGHQPPLDPSNIDLTDVFDGPTQVRSSTTTPRNTPVAELDMSAIFTSPSSSPSTSRVNLDKFTPRTIEKRQETVSVAAPTRHVVNADPLDMEIVFNPAAKEETLASSSTYPVLITKTEEMEDSIKNSVPTVIAEELVSEVIEEALRSPKLEKEETVMISISSFPVCIVEKDTDSHDTNSGDVTFGLDASPGPINLDQVFSGVSSESKPRVYLSKFEARTLERRHEAAPKHGIITNSSVPVLVTDPVDMDQVFNPSSTMTKNEDVPSITITNSSVPVIVAEEVVSEAMDEALRSPKLEKADDHGLISNSSFPVFLVEKKQEPSSIKSQEVHFGLNSRSASPEPVDLDQVFSGVSSKSKPRVDMSKFEARTLERKKQPAPVLITNSSIPVIVADPLDMDQVFNPTSSHANEDVLSIVITNSSVPVIIAEDVVSGAMEDALRSPKLEDTDRGLITSSTFPVFVVEKEEPSGLKIQDQEVHFGLNSRSASPEPIDLDHIFSRVSSESKPRVDLSKFEARTLERRKGAAPIPAMVTNSSVPVIIADPVDMDQLFNSSTSRRHQIVPTPVTNSSVPAIVAEEVAAVAIEEALRSPKVEENDNHGMISQSSFPVFLVDKPESSLEKSNIDLDSVFTGASSTSQPRVDLSKFEARTLERRKQPARTVVEPSTSAAKVIADPLDMDIVFNPASEYKKEEASAEVPPDVIECAFTDRPSSKPDHSIVTTNSSVPAIIAEEVAASAIEEALRSPKLEKTDDHGMISQSSFPVFLVDKPTSSLEKTDVNLDAVFTGAASTSQPRVDLSKFEARTLERRKQPVRTVIESTTSAPKVIADPLNMDLVFNPASESKEEEPSAEVLPVIIECAFTDRPSSKPHLDLVSNSIAKVIVADAFDEAVRSPAFVEASSTASFAFEKEERMDSFAVIDSATSLDRMVEHAQYPKRITHVQSSAPTFDIVHEDISDISNELAAVEEEKVISSEEEELDDQETPLPVFARSRNPAYDCSTVDRPFVSQSEDAPLHIADPITVVTDLTPTSSIKKIINPEPSAERVGPNVSTIDLDEVFAVQSGTASESRVDLDKFQPRTLERHKAPAKVQQEEKRESTTPALPASDINVDDIFNPRPQTHVVVEAASKPPRSQQPSDSDPMDDPAAEVDLDSVFDNSFGSDSRVDSTKFTRQSIIGSVEPDRSSSLLPTTEVITAAPIPPPRRSPRPSEAGAEESPALMALQPKTLVSRSSFPILIADEETPTPPPRRAKSPPPRMTYPGVILVDEIQYPAPTETPPPSLSTTPVPPTRHRRTDSISLQRSRTTSYSRISGSIAETEEESSLTVDATFSAQPTEAAARPSVTVTESADGGEATVDITLPPRPPPVMSFPPPPPVDETDYEVGHTVGKMMSTKNHEEEHDEPMSTTTSTVEEEEVKEARLMASPDYPPLSVITAPVEIDMNQVFDSRILTPNRYDADRWQPRTLEREKKKAVVEKVEKREKSDLPESNVDIDEIFSGRLTTTSVDYVSSPTRMTLKKPEESREKWEDDLSKEIDDYEKRRNRLGQETGGSMRSMISCSSSIPFSATPDETWKRKESMRSIQEPVVALLEKEKNRKVSSASSKSGKSAKNSKRPGSGASWKVEHVLEPQSDGLIETAPVVQPTTSGAEVEAREAKKNGKMWRVDRVQKAASASIEDIDDDKGVRIQVHTIPPPRLSASLDSLDDIERSIDEVFDDALSPRGRRIEITRIPSSSLVHVEVHRHDDQSEPYPHPEYTTETIQREQQQYRSVTSLPSTSETTNIVFPLESVSSPHGTKERFVTSASIRLEKTLPTPDTTLERTMRTHRQHIHESTPLESTHLHWEPCDIPVPVTLRKRSRSEGPLGLLEDVVVDGPDSDDIRNWHPSSVRSELEDRGYKGMDERIHGSLTTTVRVAGYSSPKSSRSREARERRKKIIRKSRHSVSSSTSNGESTSTRPDEEEMLEVEVTKRHIILRGSYNLVVAKDEPLGLLLLSLSGGQPIVPAALDFSVLPKLRRLLREAMTRRARSVSILSSRGASLLELSCPATDNLMSAAADLFHPIDNPRGKVNLCTAENRVCEREVSRKLEEIRFHPDTHRWMQRYSGNGGLKLTKQSLISHFNQLLSVSINEDEAVLLPSCTAAYDVLSHLCCDPHDVILTPTPYYARIRNDCAERNECRLEQVQLDMSKPELFVSDFEREFSVWASKGERVRAIILVNPHNPLGNIFTAHQILSVCEWAISNDVFIIVDEILAGTIYTESNLRHFPSMLGLKNQLSKPEMMVWMGSLSKDLGIPGIRTALVVVPSATLREAVVRIENLSAVPAPSQLIINQLIADKVWLSSTLLSSRRRLHSHSRFVVDSLADIDVPCVIPASGICLMADFTKFMPEATSEAENALHRRLIEHGVVLTKGESTLAPEPGWFRISFGLPKEELELGMRRIYSTYARDATLTRTIDYEEKSEAKKEWLVADVRPTSPGTTVESA